MSVYLYIEINMMSAMLLVMLSVHLLAFDRTLSSRSLAGVFLTETAFYIADAASVLIDGTAVPVFWNYFINAIYFTCSVFCAYAWLSYVYYALGGGPSKKKRRLIRLPAFLISALAVTAGWNGLLFTIAPGNLYTRGPLYPLQPVVSFFFLVLASIHSLRAGKTADTYTMRRKAKVLGIFVYFPVLAALLDILIPDIPFICPVTTVALVFVYISLQRQMITKDTLTGINNRYELQRFMDMKRLERDRSVWLIMLDVDRFKKINDTYGHLAGDLALRRMADALSKVASRRDFFIARYGGDEFVAVCTDCDEAGARAIVDEIRSAVLLSNEGENILLTVSAGAAACDFKRGWETCLNEADRELYADKNAKL